MPEDAAEEFTTLWKENVEPRVTNKEILEEGHPEHKLYFPPIVGTQGITGPKLYTIDDAEASSMQAWMMAFLKENGITDDDMMPMRYGLDTFKSCYLVMSMLSKMGVLKPKSKLILPK